MWEYLCNVMVAQGDDGSRWPLKLRREQSPPVSLEKGCRIAETRRAGLSIIKKAVNERI